MEKRTKIRFSAEQATQIILDMLSDSDMSDLGEVQKRKNYTILTPCHWKSTRKRKLMKAKLTLKNKQMARGVIYRGEHIDGEKNILQLVTLKLMRIQSVLSLMMLLHGLH